MFILSVAYSTYICYYMFIKKNARTEREENNMEKKYRLVTETGRVLLGGETYSHNAAERWFDDFNGIYEDDETGSEERIYIEEV